MRTHGTFQADFSKQASPGEPAGRDLAQHLASHLDAAGFAASAPQPHEGYAFTFACRRANQTFSVFVALVDDGVQEWLVYAEPRTGAVARLLGRVGLGRARNAEPPLRELCAAIHRCVHDDPRFRSVRWYTTAGWDTNPDADWARAPE